MTDSVLTALRAAGVDARPTASLDREGAFFALTDDALIYLDGRGKNAVNLRDITRIHSDRDGILRVEAGATTAITAPLIGFEVPRVQHFFAEVRHATARAKTLPATPEVQGSSSWKTSYGASYNEAPASAVPEETGGTGGGHVTVVRPVTPAPEVTPDPVSAAPEATAPEPAPAAPVTPSVPAAVDRTDEARPAPRQPAPVEEAPEPIRISSAPPSGGQRSRVQSAQGAPEELRRFSPEQGAPLARFAPTLRLLAALMAVTGLGVGLLQWRGGEALSGLWTIGVGGVGAFALYVFGEVVRALGQLMQSLRRNGE